VEDLAKMKAAGFGGVFCNIGDASGPDKWSSQRQQAQAQGMFCGPWLRTADANNEWDVNRFHFLLDTADAWESPLIVNCEKEIDWTGDDLTGYIAEQLDDREAAMSTEQMPFGAVDWKPVAHLPILPQVFPAETGRGETAEQTRQAWWDAGVNCVYMTYGSYAAKHGDPDASWYILDAPYSIYTADDCAYDYAAWSPTSHTYEGCRGIPPPDGGDMPDIGSQHGIIAAYNRMKAIDPEGCNPDFDPNNYDAIPLNMLKAWDKQCRTLLILAADHDAVA
jgi:hypothetical protein